jgi:hypothetical protein
MQNNTSFKSALRMDSARPRVQTRVFFTALLAAATFAVGCGDDAADPTGAGFPPGQTNNPATTPGLTGGGGAAVPPANLPPSNLPPTTGVSDAGAPVGTGTGTGTTGNTNTPWCKVKAIVDKNCAVCHTTPSVGGAPFPLQSYADVTAASPSKPGKKIYERMAVRVHADKAAAEGLTTMPATPLSAADLATIDSWVAAGAPAGENPTCAGAAGGPVASAGGDAGTPTGPDVWPLPECDAVYKVLSHGSGGPTSPMSVPPGQEVHPQVTSDAPWGNEKVQAIGFKAVTDNKAVLHHWILNGGGAFLSGWAPGEDGVKKMLPDVGMEMPTGAGSLRLDMHYNSLQQKTAQNDNSGVEICIVKSAHFRKNHAAVTMGLSSLFNLSVPNGSTNYEVKSSCTVGSGPITLLSASPHAHKLAVRMKFTLQRKSGELVTMHDMPFMFGEQHSYPLDPPIITNAGDVINTSCYYTNMTGATVTFGENTGNEMCFNFALYYPAGSLSCGAGGLDIGSLFGGGP